MTRVYSIALVGLIVSGLAFGAGIQEPADDDTFAVGVFVPGVVDGSPTYEMMVAGVTAAVAAETAAGASVTYDVIEGGVNQATWLDGLTSMAAGGRYDVLVTSNPSMPEIAAEVAARFPDARVIVLDGELAGNAQIRTVQFDQAEQAWLSGYFAGLVTTSGMDGANGDLRVGLLAGQEYPVMNGTILPSFAAGARAAAERTRDGAATVDFRVLGNWFDAGQAQEIATDMYASGADVVLTIAGGGNQGVIAAARSAGTYVLWYDSSGYDQAPGIVVGSSFVQQAGAAERLVRAAIAGTLDWGTAETLGIADGAVGFDTTHPAFMTHVPAEVRDAMEAALAAVAAGELGPGR